MKLIIVSGQSGSGKSIALRVLEDLGYYCVDNLPVTLLPQLLQTLKSIIKSTWDTQLTRKTKLKLKVYMI